MSEQYRSEYGIDFRAEPEHRSEYDTQPASFGRMKVGAIVLGALLAAGGLLEHEDAVRDMLGHKAVAAERMLDRSDLVNEIGLQEVNAVASLDSVDSAEERNVELSTKSHLIVEGLDGHDITFQSGSHAVLTSGRVRHLFDSLPAGFQSHRQQLAKVEFRNETADEASELHDAYASGSDRSVSHFVDAAAYDQRTNTITLYPASTRSAQDFDDTVYHEFAHRNDWSTNHLLTYDERVHLLEGVLRRLSAADRFHSAYVESITNDDDRVERYTKAREYWAEIFAAYASHDSIRPLPPEDRALVEFVLSREQAPEVSR